MLSARHFAADWALHYTFLSELSKFGSRTMVRYLCDEGTRKLSGVERPMCEKSFLIVMEPELSLGPPSSFGKEVLSNGAGMADKVFASL
jgi:hypothetical protein